MLRSSKRGIGVYKSFGSLLWPFLLLWFALLQQTWGRAVSCVPGSAVIVVIYACAVTCGQSFTMFSVWDVLISFWSVLMFSPTLLSLLLLLPYYYYCLYFCYYYWLLLLLLFPQSSRLCMTGAWAGAGYGGLFVCSCYPSLGSAAPAPRRLGTQPPCATQALRWP